MATALQIVDSARGERREHVVSLRDRLAEELPKRIEGLHITGPKDMSKRLPNSFSCCFEGVEGESILLQLDLKGISASSGSACTTGSLEPSHVLLAMGVPHALARGSLRLTLGKDNTADEIERLVQIIPESVERLRSLAPGRKTASRS